MNERVNSMGGRRRRRTVRRSDGRHSTGPGSAVVGQPGSDHENFLPSLDDEEGQFGMDEEYLREQIPPHHGF